MEGRLGVWGELGRRRSVGGLFGKKGWVAVRRLRQSLVSFAAHPTLHAPARAYQIAKEHRELAQAFSEFDEDKSGYLSHAEYLKAVMTFGEPLTDSQVPVCVCVCVRWGACV